MTVAAPVGPAPSCDTEQGAAVARKTIITLVDDLDGSEAVTTVTFGLDGRNYEIDLSDSNEAALRDVLAPYVDGARKLATRGRASRRSK
ncbi:Lsr2 family protein [uncultured Nocardioides sp.]|uniref:histone-like nucleoid-structuring protein Lsr2 n=1 Tax=uncultured Nocardioides sp. TaxID=198441 RepID=UPI00262BE71A|nr:Lsr2 family protein [uncultured Nocardioides sp.]